MRLSRPARRNSSAVSALRPSDTAVASAIRPSTKSGRASAFSSTLPISAMAKPNSAITLSPSMRSAWRSTQALPANARIAQAAAAAPARISTSRRPSASGESVTAGPANSATNAGAVNGVATMQTSSSASESAALSPISAASAGDEKVGGATACSISASRSAGETVDSRRRKAEADQRRHRQHGPGRGHDEQAAAATIACAARRIDPQEGKAQQHEHGFGKIRPEQRAERRQRDPEKIETATAPVPWRPSQPSAAAGAIENGHAGGISAMLAAVERVAYICADRSGRDGLEILMARTDAIVLGAGIVGTSAALHLAKRGLSVALVDRRGPGEETSYGNAGVIEGNTLFPHAFPSRLDRAAADRAQAAPEANYHLSFLPKIAPWLLAYRANTTPEASSGVRRGDAAAVCARGRASTRR